MRQAWVNEFGEQDSRSATELLGEKRVVYGFFRAEIMLAGESVLASCPLRGGRRD
jgi:hypothetical protein